MDWANLYMFIVHDPHVLHQGYVDSFGDVKSLEEKIIFLSLIDEGINLFVIESLLFNPHKFFNIFQTYIIL